MLEEDFLAGHNITNMYEVELDADVTGAGGGLSCDGDIIETCVIA